MTRSTRLEVRRCAVEDPATSTRLEAVCVACGGDLVVVVCGGAGYHVGAAALAISIPSIKDPATLTNSSYLVSVPGHKEEALARDGSLELSRALERNVVVTVGIHDDLIAKDRIQGYVELFRKLMAEIVRDQQISGPTSSPPPHSC
jgi:gallate decarboxylase subunit D